MISLALRPSPSMRPRLAQAAKPTRIIVTDNRGRPAHGVMVAVTIGSGPAIEGKTDSAGTVTLQLPSGAGDLHVLASGYDYMAPVSVPYGSDIFITLPFCVNTGLSIAEIVALLVGAGSLAAGYKWKFEPAKVTGEILLGTAAFTIIYRMSCL